MLYRMAGAGPVLGSCCSSQPGLYLTEAVAFTLLVDGVSWWCAKKDEDVLEYIYLFRARRRKRRAHDDGMEEERIYKLPGKMQVVIPLEGRLVTINSARRRETQGKNNGKKRLEMNS
jgi:hypothetical protein